MFNTRIAPSPTGYFHLGTARTAYFNWLAARATGGRFLLRIDDTDTARNQDAFIDVIHDAMGYLKLDHDCTFRQSQRLARYLQVAQDLLSAGHAVRQDGAIFLKHPLLTTSFDDAALGVLKASPVDHDYVSHMVLVKSDGMPTYHFANVVDDIDYDINFVIRGNDHVANTFKQLAVYDALGVAAPRYAHLGLLHDAKTGAKLSKSAGAKSLLDFRDAGVDADAMCNFLLRLGWGPKRDDKTTAVLPRDAALAIFLSAGNLRGTSCKADFALLDSYDRKYKGRLRNKVAA